MSLDCPIGAPGDPVVFFHIVQVLSLNGMIVVLGVVSQGLWLPALAMAPDLLLRLSVGGAMSRTMSRAMGAAVQV